MALLSKSRNWIEEHPEYIVQVMLSLTLLLVGLYILSPWYEGGSTSAIGVISDSFLGHTAIGAGYFVAGVVNIWGLAKDSPMFRYYGTMGVFGAYMFATILRVLAIGFVPVIWAFILCLSLIAGLMHIIESRRRSNE